MSKKLIALGTAAGLLSFSGVALAHDTDSLRAELKTTLSASNQHMLLLVGGSGAMHLRGTVVATSSNSVTVKSWGGSWTVNVGTSTQLLPSGHTLAKVKIGDFVGVSGQASQTANLTITATTLRDWSATTSADQLSKKEKKELKKETRKDFKAWFKSVFSIGKNDDRDDDD